MAASSEIGIELAAFFGPLELRVLEALWERGAPATVRQLLPMVGDVAYTTVMTTLDRLYRKEYLARESRGRAFAYRPLCTRDELTSSLASRALTMLLPSDPGAARPWISMFVDDVGRMDAALLDELEKEIQRKREKVKRETTE